MEIQGVTLQRKLAAARRWWRLTRVLSGLTWVLSLVVLLALVCYHSDRLLVLSVHARENWRLGIALAAGLTLLLALAQPLLRKLSDQSVAADVERRFPILRERLLTTLDLAPAFSGTNGASNGHKPYTHAFSEQMTTALAQETHKVASDLNFKRAVSLRPLRNGTLTLVFTLALLFLHVFFAPEAFATWLRRMSDPHADIPPYAKTRVQVIPDVTLLPRGEGTYVTVKTWGDPVDRCVLRVHQDGEDPKTWTNVELKNPVPVANANPDEKDARKFRYHFGILVRSISLVASANDGRSNERDVRVEDRPTLLNVRLNLHFPAYMHRKDQSLPETTGAIAAPVGTQVDVVGVANKRLKSAVFVRDNVEAGNWPVSGSQISGRVSVSRDGSYRLKLVDTHNFAGLNPPRYEIRAMKDDAPNVQILRPATDVDLVPGGSLPLIAHATDDYGVSTAKLLYDTTHEDANREGRNSIVHVGKGAFTLPAEYGLPSVDIRQRWFISSVQPRVGDIIQYEVNGWDNDTLSGPHVGRSVAYRIRVVSTATMQAQLKEKLDSEQQALTAARQHQIEAQKQLAQARARNDAAQMARAQEAQRSVSQETKALAQRVQDLSNQLENNNFATKSEMERRQQAQQTLDNSAQQKMIPAADKMQQAQNAKANSPERSQNLQQADQQQTEAKKDIERAQELLSRTQTAEQLAKNAQQAAQDQQRLADSSRSLAEDIKQQQQQNKNNSLTPEQKTALEMQRRQQAQVSDDTRKLEKQLDQAAQEAQQRGDTKQAEDLKRATDALKQGDAKGNQNQAQKNLGQNKPQQAAGAQDKAASALQKAAESAAKAAGQETPTDPKTAAEKAEAAAQQLHELAKQQQELAKQVGENPNSEQSKELGQKEQQIQQMAQQAQQNLEGAKAAQQSAQKAQQNLSQSQQKLSQNQPQGAKQPAKDAAQQLEDAARQAERAAEQMRQQQQAQEIADKVERLAQIQHALETTTKRVDDTLHAPKDAPHDLGAATRERRQVAERQLKLEKEAQELTQKIPSKAFQQALKMASGQMHTANENLNGKDLQGTDEPDAGKDTQKAQHRAAQTLDTVTQALKQQAQANNQQQQQQGQQQQGQQGSPEQQQAAEAAGELALAQGLQKQLRQDTGALDQQRAKNPNQTLTPDQQKDANQLTQGQQSAQEITQNAARSLENAAPDAAQSAKQAGEHMDQAHQKLQQKQTGQPTQGQQDQAIEKLGQAQKQAEQAQQQQQQQQQQSQQEQQGAPKPGQKSGGKPGQNPFARLEGVQRGQMSAPGSRSGKGFSQLSGRDQRTLRDGENERVPAEYQDLVSRYYKGLAEKKR